MTRRRMTGKESERAALRVDTQSRQNQTKPASEAQYVYLVSCGAALDEAGLAFDAPSGHVCVIVFNTLKQTTRELAPDVR